MTLAIGWLHEAGDPPHPSLRGGSMTLAIRWLHEAGETLGTWLHEAGDWHPWRGADGCGVAAQGRHTQDESDRKQASREERAMIEAPRTRRSRSTTGRAGARR
jgi:hypothetical protein